MARVASTSLFKRIRVFSNFCVYSNLLKTANNFTGVESLGTAPKFELGIKKNYHQVFIFTSSKQRPVKIFHVVVVQGKEIYQEACYTCKICCLTFKTFCFLTQ